MNENVGELSFDDDVTDIQDESVDIVENTDTRNVVESETPNIILSQEPETTISFEETVGWVGGDSTNHNSLNGRDDPDQHTISAITGLSEKLKNIEALKSVQSNHVNHANYYQWANDGRYNEFGYFVSLVPHSDTITVCNGEDIFGVTVHEAGFIGRQEEIPRDNQYALVVTSGLVDVRCESEVVEGDYVISNSHGVAEKTNSGCGYKVIAKENKNGVDYASIALGLQACTTDMLGKNLQHLDERMINTEANLAAVMNVANEAYKQANSGIINNQEMSDKIDNVIGEIGDMGSNLETMENQLGDALAIIAQAKAMAESAATFAEITRDEAVKKANEALDKAGEIEKTVEPISKWEYTDPVTGETNTGATYFAEYVKNGLSTKAEMETVSKLDEENKLLIEKNAENYIQMLSSVDKYTIGEHSQAYGLTNEQAKNILKEGMVYIPTINHIEPFFADGTVEVLRNAFYVWTGEAWGYETLNSVWLGNNDPGIAYQYWYIESDTAPDGYEPHTLYVLEDNTWKQVATLAGNVNNRLTSMIRQDVNSVAMEVSNARGSAATLGARLDEDGAKVHLVASVVTELKDVQPAGIYDTVDEFPTSAENDAYYCVGSSAPYDVYKWNGTEFKKELSLYYDGAHFCKVNTASIVNAVNNNGDRSISLNADKINFSGLSTFFSTDENGGITAINGDGIITGTIDASRATITNINASNITTGTIDASKITVKNLHANSIIVDDNNTVEDKLNTTLVSSKIYYALSTSVKIAPTDGWSEEAPQWTDDGYMWQKTVNIYGDGSMDETITCLAGASPIVVQIECSTGNLYINRGINATLTAKAYQANKDITNEFPDEAFLWEKYDVDGVRDTIWSHLGKSVIINNTDVWKRAVFNCVLDIEQRI